MPSLGNFLQTYVNNRHNLLFALIIVIAIVISLIPELVLYNAKEELLNTIFPKSEGSIPSTSDRSLTHKQTVFPPHFFSTNNLAFNRNLTKELEEYFNNLEKYNILKENVAVLSAQLSKIESYQEQQREVIPTPPTPDTTSTTPSKYQEKLQTQYETMINKQNQLITLIKQVKDYQTIQEIHIKQLEQNLTNFLETHLTEKQYIEHHLQRLHDKLNYYQIIVNRSYQQHSFYNQLMNNSNYISKSLLEVNQKIKQVMIYDEKLCKDRIQLLKRHQIKFQKDEFEQLIKTTVNEKLQLYASLQETNTTSQSTNNASHRPYDEHSCHPVQMKVQEKPDYALLSAGAEVLLAETSPTYVPYELQLKNALHQIAHNLGLEDYFPSDYIPQFESTHQWTEAVGLFYGVGSVQDVLRPDIKLGNCWPMNGTSGYFTVKLRDPIFIESISLDHIGKSEARDWRTAPKNFRVFGSFDLARGWRELVADYFEPNRTTASHNYIIPPSEDNYGPVQYLKLNILSNHGNPEYTCLYRFRIHGEVV